MNRSEAERKDERRSDDAVASSEREKGMALGSSKNVPLLMAAQTVAREIGQNGVVTIDDVVRRMEQLGYKDLRGEEGAKAKNWKGSVFDTSEWVCVGSIASRDKTAHGRHVRQWALKSWLRLHPVNGTMSDASAFSLYKVYQEAAHCYPVGTELCMLLGKEMLDASFAELCVQKTGYDESGRPVSSVMSVYGIPVFPMTGVGVIVVPRRSLETSLRSIVISSRAIGD